MSKEVDSAPCEVLNLRDVTSLFDCSTGQRHEFVMQILKERLQCSADDQETLRTHLRHIAKVLLPWPVPDSELAGGRCLSRVTAREEKWPEHRDAWAALRGTELLLYLTGGRQRDRLRLTLSQNYTYIASENMIEIISPERTLSLRFKHSWPCEKWGVLLKEALQPSPSSPSFGGGSLYPSPGRGSTRVPDPIKRCISHITQHAIPEQAERLHGYREVLEQLSGEQRDILSRLFGHLYQVQAHSQVNHMTPQNLALVFVPTLFPDQTLSTDAVKLTGELITHYTALFHGGEEEEEGLTVEGIYRRCGHVGKISRLVEGLHSTPCRAQFEKGELGVVDVSGALKQCLRLHGALFPEPHLSHWLQSAAIPEQAERLHGYREVLEQLSGEQRDILSRLFGHLYQVQAHSQVNHMTPQNLALVFVPTLFPDQALSTDAVKLTRELITHYTALFHVFALIQVALKEPLDMHWIHKVLLFLAVVIVAAGIAGICVRWMEEWGTALLSLQVTAPFLQLGGVAAVSLLGWFVFQRFFMAKRTVSRVFILMAYLIVVAAVFLSPLVITSPCLLEIRKLPPKPALIGHRGAPMFFSLSLLFKARSREHNDVVPEEYGVWDGVPFLMHDDSLKRTTNVLEKFPERANNSSSTFSWKELQSLNTGDWYLENDPFQTVSSFSKLDREEARNQSIPSLRDLLNLARKHNTSVIFDLKKLSPGHPYEHNYTQRTIETILNSSIPQQLVLWLVNKDRDRVAAMPPGFQQVYADKEAMRVGGGDRLNIRHSFLSGQEIRRQYRSQCSFLRVSAQAPDTYRAIWITVDCFFLLVILGFFLLQRSVGVRGRGIVLPHSISVYCFTCTAQGNTFYD
ncbi:UNVERIFIED_CONTAM: hypothetical protein FKN15_061512 [Acipenser sinensis]